MFKLQPYAISMVLGVRQVNNTGVCYMVVCLLRLMYGPFVYDGAEHVIATWTIVIAVARTAAVFVVVLRVRALR